MRHLPAIYVLRHGETAWNREGRCQGHLDAPLTDLGQAQAARQGRILRDQVFSKYPDCDVLVSPLGRTRATWAVVAEAAGVPVDRAQVTPRLAEVNMGDWQGRLRDEFLAEDADARAHPNLFELSLNAPGGERFEDLSVRINALLTEITRPTVCVTHGITSLVMRGLIRGISRHEMAGQGHDQGIVYGLWDGHEHRLEEDAAD